MITKILWMVIYLAVGYLMAIATEEDLRGHLLLKEKA